MKNIYLDEDDWRAKARWNSDGFFDLRTLDTGDCPVRLFLSPKLLAETEVTLYRQIVHATRFSGAKLVCLTPDAHHGFGVPVGCVILTDARDGAIAMGPVGYDIGCGMISARSNVPAHAATHDRKLAFNREVIERVPVGLSGGAGSYSAIDKRQFLELAHGGVDSFRSMFDAEIDQSRMERGRLPVDDSWEVPWGGVGRPERGIQQLGSLGGGNHFIELQSGVPDGHDPRDMREGHLFVQIHTGSRGFGHGLATNYFELARRERPESNNIDLGFFTPDSPHYRGYQNAVAAAGNFALINRAAIFWQVAAAFAKVFRADLELVYEISHNLVQRESHEDFGDVWVHRKGATRAFPARHPALKDTLFFDSGHPVLIPGSNRDESYILRPLQGARRSAYSVNHGAGRRMSRGDALRSLSQQKVNEQYREAKIVVNDDSDVPLDESASCYKSSDEVISTVVDAGLARVEHRLWPLASIKGTEQADGRKKRDRAKAGKARTLERKANRRQ
jgi:tRNA-splicing ligase RtcB